MLSLWIIGGFLAVMVLPQIIPFIVYGVDKLLAKAGTHRVPEAGLLAVSFLFGGLGSLAGMLIFRHKIKKLSFQLKFWPVWLVRGILLGLAGFILFKLFF